MAYLGEIYLGGFEGDSEGEIFTSGVAFFLEEDSSISKEVVLDDGWEVKIEPDHKVIVARNKNVLPMEELLSSGLEACQRSLDLISVSEKKQMQIEKPGDMHVILFKENDDFIVRYVSICDIPISINMSIVKKDEEGNVLPDPPEPEIKWTPSFRYYRLSQNSNDLFEAYRNLFLALEVMLNEICPKNDDEREKEWLKRALTEINENVSFSSFVPSDSSNSIAYLVGTLYEYVRCGLFHAKEDYILPYENLNPIKVNEAYERLTKLWREIAEEYFNVSKEGGGLTNYGFEFIMDKGFKSGFDFNVTSDSSPVKKDNKKVSPLGYPVFSCQKTSYEGMYKPGHVLLTGNIEKSDKLQKIDLIHRIGTKVEEKLICVASIEDGLKVSGISKFENFQIFRLVGKDSPEAIF